MSDSLPTRRIKLSELQFDPENANLGSARGDAAITESIRRFGFADAGILDRNGVLIGGNKRTHAADALGMEDAIIIKHDGKTPIYLQIDDFDLNSDDTDVRKRSRELAYYLNRTAQLSLNWSPSQFAADQDSGLDLDTLWLPEEAAELKLSLTTHVEDTEFDYTEFEESAAGEVRFRVVIDSLERPQAEELQRTITNARIEQYRV